MLLVATACFLTLSGYAQRSKATDDVLDKKVLSVKVEGPELVTLEMGKELSLNEDQQKEVELLNKVLYEQMLTAKERFSDSFLQHATTVRVLQLQNDKALKRVLTEEQLKKYLELEGRQHASYLSELD